MKIKSIQSLKSAQRGFTLAEIIIAIAVVAFLLMGAIQYGNNVMMNSRVTKTADHIRMISGAAVNWAAGRFNYAGVSMAQLEGSRLLPNGFTANGTPFGGVYTVAGAGMQFTVTASGFPTVQFCQQAVDKIQRDVLNANCAGTTLTAVFGTN